MPLPWKKTRVARISRLVADLQSPKHGNSLVVETGFPTSLVDLFVKNRDRLKKKKKRAPASEFSAVDAVILPTSPPPPPPPPQPQPQPQPQPAFHSVIEGECIEEREDKTQVEESASCSGRRRLLPAVLSMFVVVVLALSTKRFTVGITASAFLLSFLEYLGKHFASFLKPCFRSKQFEQCRDFKTLTVEDLKEPIVKEGRRAGSTVGRLASSEEIQVVEGNFGIAAKVEEIRTQELELKLMERGVEEDQDTSVSVLNREGSRRERLKAKIKKILPKKLRRREKRREGREPESCSGEISSSCDGEVEEPEIGDKQVLAVQGKPQLLSPLEEREEEKLATNFDDGIHSLNIQSQAIEGKDVAEESLEIVKKGKSGYLFIFLIVLLGLVGGRVVAVLLTVSGCLITKLFRSSVSSSSWNLGW